MLASPLPHYFHGTYSLSTSSLGCKTLCIIMNFLVLWSICWSSFLFSGLQDSSQHSGGFQPRFNSSFDLNSHFSCPIFKGLGTVPNTKTTIGITVTLTFQSFFLVCWQCLSICLSFHFLLFSMSLSRTTKIHETANSFFSY